MRLTALLLSLPGLACQVALHRDHLGVTRTNELQALSRQVGTARSSGGQM